MFRITPRIDAKRLGLILAVMMTAGTNVWSQTAIPTDTQTHPTNQTTGSTDQSRKESSDSSQPTQTAAKKQKRGSLVFAPIPITSPAVGSGLVLVVGYVFKMNQDDKLSPPSTVGAVGAFTNNGTRAGGIGGRLYFNENKYQTTFALAKGRQF